MVVCCATGLFLQRTPVLVSNPVYLPLILVATAFAVLVAQRIENSPSLHITDNAVIAIDSLGVPAFAVVGTQLALAAGISIPGVLLIGVINGIGGGLLRDVLVNEQPMLLRPGHHVTLILLASCLLYVTLTRAVGVQSNLAGWLVVGFYVAVRGITLYFDLRTKPVVYLTRA